VLPQPVYAHLSAARNNVDNILVPQQQASPMMLYRVANRPRSGWGSQARTPQLVWTSWRGSGGQEPAKEAQLGRDQLYRTRQVLDRSIGFPYIYKYELR